MSKFLKVRILVLIAASILLGTFTIAATFAFLSDTETSTANTFDAGTLDLKIDNTSYYNGEVSPSTTWQLDDLDGKLFFNFTDVKPGDWGEDTISIHVVNNDAWGCFETTTTSDDDISSNEPELLDGDLPENAQDTSDGELGDTINFVFWVDDGDNVLESDETDNIISQGTANQVLTELKVVLADSLSSIFSPSPTPVAPLAGEATYYIAKAWCFGTLGLVALQQDGQGANSPRNPANSTGGVTCDGSQLSNITQTDAFTADIQFSAIQHRSNPNFTCYETPTLSPSPTPTNTPTPTPTNTPTPTPPTIACTSVDNIFASSASNNNQGTRKNATPILVDRTNPPSMFGAPQTAGLPSDVGIPVGSFFSLGFTGGNIVLGFAEPFYPNPSGADLQVFEVTGGTYPDEGIKVEVGPTAIGPWTIATPNPGIRDAGFEMGVASAQFVKLTESSNIALFEPEADGYDVDAVKAFCTASTN